MSSEFICEMNNFCKCLAPCLPGRFPGKQSLRQSWSLLEATSGIKTWGRAGKGRERKGREGKELTELHEKMKVMLRDHDGESKQGTCHSHGKLGLIFL